MLFTDITAIITFITLAYIGYTQGVFLRSSFLVNLFSTSIFFYTLLPLCHIFVAKYVTSYVACNYITFVVSSIPMFAVSHFVMNKISQKYKQSNIITIKHRFLGTIVGVVTAYLFIASTFVFVEQDFKYKNSLWMQSSGFYKIAKLSSESDIKSIKVDNLPSLAFMYDAAVVNEFNINEQALHNITMLLRGIPNSSAHKILLAHAKKLPLPDLYKIAISDYKHNIHEIEKKYLLKDESIIAIENLFGISTNSGHSISEIIDSI